MWVERVNLAIDRARRVSAGPVDPNGWLVGPKRDTRPLPDEATEVRLEAALIRQVVESLDEREAAVIKLRFDCHLNSKEIQRSPGAPPSGWRRSLRARIRALSRR
jgi:DNA-directed RNA polymerase specialized sigma subunit